MNLERRLQHAARELRSVEVVPPELGLPGATARRGGRIPALVAPALFVLGGLVFTAGALGNRAEPLLSDTSTAVTTPDAVPLAVDGGADAAPTEAETATDAGGPPAVPSPADEVRLIASLTSARPSAAAATDPQAVIRPGPGGVI